MNLIKAIESEQTNIERANFRIGDTVKVHFKIVEGKTERIQIFEGVVIAIKNSGVSRTFTVRKISFNIGVERVFPLYSPRIDRVEIVRSGKVRRGKLYYLRNLTGKSARIKEKIKPKAH